MNNGLFAVVIVLGLVGALAWLLRSGRLGQFAAKGSIVAIETAVSLGERRQVVVIAVEGRRLLLGVTPGSVSLITELAAASDRRDPRADTLAPPSQVVPS